MYTLITEDITNLRLVAEDFAFRYPAMNVEIEVLAQLCLDLHILPFDFLMFAYSFPVWVKKVKNGYQAGYLGSDEVAFRSTFGNYWFCDKSKVDLPFVQNRILNLKAGVL